MQVKAKRLAGQHTGAPSDVNTLAREDGEDEEWLPAFASQFPTPAAAAQAARQGRTVAAWLSFEEADHRIAVRVESDGSTQRVRQIYVPRLGMGTLLYTALLNSGYTSHYEHESIAKAVQALRRYGSALGVPAEIEPFAEPGNGQFPRFGWRHVSSFAETGAWSDALALPGALAWLEREQVNEVWRRLPGRTTSNAFSAEQRRWDLLLDALRGEGLTVHTCGRCGEPITDRHGEWPGLWITLSVDGDLAVCPEVRAPLHEQYARGSKAYDTVSLGAPHAPEPLPGNK